MHKKLIVTLTGILLMTVVAAEARTPWQWQFTMQYDKEGGAMLSPVAMFADQNPDRYYVVDSGNNRLLSFDRQGVGLHAFSADNSLEAPMDMVKEEGGILWIIERGKNSLTKVDLQARKVTPNTLRDGERTIIPQRLLLSDGKFLILDKESGRIYRFDMDLSVQGSFGCEGCQYGIFDMAEADGVIWGLARRENMAYGFDRQGKEVKRVAFNRQMDFPVSLAVDQAGRFFVLDRHQGRINVFDRQGHWQYDLFQSGHTQGRLYFPSKVAFDPWGRLCVVDQGNGRVEVYQR